MISFLNQPSCTGAVEVCPSELAICRGIVILRPSRVFPLRHTKLHENGRLVTRNNAAANPGPEPFGQYSFASSCFYKTRVRCVCVFVVQVDHEKCSFLSEINNNITKNRFNSTAQIGNYCDPWIFEQKSSVKMHKNRTVYHGDSDCKFNKLDETLFSSRLAARPRFIVRFSYAIFSRYYIIFTSRTWALIFATPILHRFHGARWKRAVNLMPRRECFGEAKLDERIRIVIIYYVTCHAPVSGRSNRFRLK